MANDQNTLINNGVKLLGEAFVTPGSSLILEGRVGAGLFHGALGLAAISLLGPVAGPVARLLIAANFYSRSISDRNVWEVAEGDETSRPESGRPESGRSTSRSTAAAPST